MDSQTPIWDSVPSFEAILAAIGSDEDSCDKFYEDYAPRKQEQEFYTGVQVVSMNMDFLADWIEQTLEPNLANECCRLSQSARLHRKMFDASFFKYGCNGFQERDVGFYFQGFKSHKTVVLPMRDGMSSDDHLPEVHADVLTKEEIDKIAARFGSAYIKDGGCYRIIVIPDGFHVQYSDRPESEIIGDDWPGSLTLDIIQVEEKEVG